MEFSAEELNMEKIIINKSKSIGDVVFVLEGKDDEFRLFANIFEKIFSVTTIKCRSKSTDLREYHLPDNRDSVVYLLNSKTSSIKSVDDNEYIESLFIKINEHFNIDISNAAIFYIWDRDKDSNKSEIVEKMLTKYQNSRDNEYEMQGLLLLSYPAIESFMISCFENETDETFIENMKKYLTSKKYHYKKINEEKIINATQVFLKRYEKVLKKEFDIGDIDLNMKDNNLAIFKFEEDYYSKKQFYYYFSTIIIALLDLGFIELTE